MKSTVVWALVALNCVLLAALVGRYVKPNEALAAGGRRGDYIIIPGEVAGGNNAVVYILDTSNRKLSARVLNNAGRDWRLDDMAPIDLDRILTEEGGDERDDRNG